MNSSAAPWISTAGGGRGVEVYALGRVDFDSSCQLQARMAEEISCNAAGTGAVLLCEHPPVISMGREASYGDLHADYDRLHALRIDVKWLARGGGAFVHVPGQLAIYPILPIQRWGVSPSVYRLKLETAVALACRELRVPAQRKLAIPGLWSRAGQIAYFGAALRDGVTSQGIFLNVAPWPGFLNLTTPTNHGHLSTSLQAMRLRPISMSAVKEAVIRHLAEQFQFDNVSFSTSHPLLVRTRQKVSLHA